MMDLLEYNVGKGLCHAWYARRFFESVSVSELQMPHSGVGLDCYVQWSSPIRRFSDLLVHACVKRYLRRRKVYKLLQNGQHIPEGVSAFDLGVSAEAIGNDRRFSKDLIASDDLDNDLNFLEGAGLVGAARKLQRQSQQYWLFEYIRRQKETDPSAAYCAVVLGCADPEKQQYAVYVKELGLEHRYTSPGGRLDPGTELLVRVDTVSPRSGVLSFVRIV
jgi:exoribonuclease R